MLDTLFELLNKYYVEVPIIQRDYVQGRQDIHTKMVSDNLLCDMKSAILGETPPLDLNFVYGKADADKFIPIDGQQRLTTLFLLHLYAFRNDETKTELLRKFTYKTRTSSRNFFEKLTVNRETVFSSEMVPSKEIEDSEWFVLSWKYDPTIESVLIILDKIKSSFKDITNLDQCLTNPEFEPIIFKFLDMNNLGMEDSLYIKLNARGKPLSVLENFKARLIGCLQKMNSSFISDFELKFDGAWTDLFWKKSCEDFDRTFLAFFGILFMNNGLFDRENDWTNQIDYNKIEEQLFETAFYTLNFICKNNEEVAQLIFSALTVKPTYKDRVLFHAVTTYMYNAKGVDDGSGSLKQWLRITKNLIINTQIDTVELYRKSIEAINSLSNHWRDLLSHMLKNEPVAVFSREQIEEERIKVELILQEKDFAEAIYKAEQHPYFSGQIRSALYLAREENNRYNQKLFNQYWDKISALFENTKPKHGDFLRRALLTYGDYTLTVGAYKTLCVDDPNESSSTPSLKRLFSNHGDIIKNFLHTLNSKDDIKEQLENIIHKATLPKNDWRYCFVNFPGLFKWMSSSHLRLRQIDDELLIVPNKSSNGYSYEVFTAALHEALKQNGISAILQSDLGTWSDRYLTLKGCKIKYRMGKFIFEDEDGKTIYETKTDDPIAEAVQYFQRP
ncbi:MAG: DUF262 domain-containing protein [Eubacteriaceae bacterium]|nr:DUF262 domain-containing protein [Eubacteriaceae bacterium]